METFAALREAAKIKNPLERVRRLNQLMAEHQSVISEAGRCKRQAVAEAKESGLTFNQIASELGVSPGRISQMKNEYAQAPDMEGRIHPSVIVQRALPTDPATRGSVSLFLVEAERQGVKADRKMLFVGVEQASDQIAAALEVEAGDDVVARRKMMTANEVPVRIATSYFRADLFSETRMAEPKFVRPSLQSALTDLGYNFGHAIETVTVRPPSEFEATTLELEPGEWIVQVLRSSFSTEGTPIHALETICAASRHVFPIGQVAGLDEF